MRRVLALLSLLGLTLACAACDGGDGKDTGAGSGTAGGAEGTDGDDGTDEGTDGGGDDTGTAPAATVVVSSVRSLAPATLPEAEGGVVQLAVRAAATDAAGAAVPLETALAATSFAVLLGGGAELDCTAEDGGDGLLHLTFTVPPGLAPEAGGRIDATLLVDGVAGPVLPIRVHTDESSLLQSFTGDPTGHIALPEAAERLGTVCDTLVVDADGDGLVEVITVGVIDGGFAVGMCAATGAADATVWVCDDKTFAVEGSRGGERCGETDHFLVDGGGVGVIATAVDAAGQLSVLGPFEADGRGFGTPSGVGLSGAGALGVVFGLNNTKKDPETPAIETMGVQGGTGSWTGVFDGPAGRWEWRSLGGYEAAAYGEGKVVAGLTGAEALWGLSGGASLVWTLDAPAASSGRKLLVEVTVPDGETKSLSRARQIELDHPGFAVEAAAGVFGDVDGDDIPELVLEVWGEGRWAAWLVPAATDKADTRPVTRLQSGLGEHVGWVQAHPGAEGAVQSSFTLTGADGDTLSAVVPVFSGVGATAEALSDTAELVEVSWDPGWLSTGSTGEAWATEVYAHGALRRGEPSEKRRGICCHGKCFASPGYGGAGRLTTGGGAGRTAASMEAGARAFVSVDPGGGGLMLAGKGNRPGAPKGMVRSARIRPLVSNDNGGALGLFDGETLVGELEAAAAVAATAEAEDGTATVLVFVPRSVAASADDSAEPAVVQVDLSIRFGAGSSSQLVLPPATTAGGTTVPVLLSQEVSAEGGVLLGWRDGKGQAWLGVVDLAGAVDGVAREAVPFLQGPVAVGAPLVDPDDGLGLSTGRPGMVPVDQGIIADTPFLSMEDLETRFEDWEEPLEVPLDQGVGAYGPVALVVGTEAGGVETRYLPPTDSLDAVETVVLVEEEAPSSTTPVPQLSAHLVADAPAVLVLASTAGVVDLMLVDDAGPQAEEPSVVVFDGAEVVLGALAAGDLNGDGIADLVLPAGTQTQLALSDGTGGLLPTTVDPATLLGFDRVLTGGGPGQEASLDPAGGRGLTLGGPALGDWTLGAE